MAAAKAADTIAAITPSQIDAASDVATSAPAIAAPIGKPAKLKAIETAKARPIHAGSVRRWRTVNSAMSMQPLSSPNANIIMTSSTRPTSGAIGPNTPAAGSRSAITGAPRIIGRTSIAHSRPRVSRRPNTRAETIPDSPDAAKTNPTTASP